MSLETALKDPAASSLTVTLQITRVRADSWVVGAFLVLVGVAVSAAAPQILSAVRLAVAQAADAGSTPRETVQRPQVRVSLSRIHLVEPTAPNGHDVLAGRALAAAPGALGDKVYVRSIDHAAQIARLGFSARAPPSRDA